LLIDVSTAQRFLARRALAEGLAAGRVRAQPLLVPVRVSASAGQVERALALQPVLSELGLDLDAVGPAELLIRALPAALAGAAGRGDESERLAGLVAALEELNPAEFGPGDLDPDTATHALLPVLAARAATPAGALTVAERDSLLRALEAQRPDGGRDEEGRPLWVVLSAESLARLFA